MNRAFSKIWIIAIIIVLLAGGILAWRYLRPLVTGPETKEIIEIYGPYESVSSPSFSSDGNFGFSCQKDNQWYININDKIYGPYESVGPYAGAGLEENVGTPFLSDGNFGFHYQKKQPMVY